jgi:hypothetical protein
VHIQRSLGGLGGATLMLVIAVTLWRRGHLRSSRITHGWLTFLLLDSLLLFVGSLLSDGGFVVQRGWERPSEAEPGG